MYRLPSLLGRSVLAAIYFVPAIAEEYSCQPDIRSTRTEWQLQATLPMPDDGPFIPEMPAAFAFVSYVSGGTSVSPRGTRVPYPSGAYASGGTAVSPISGRTPYPYCAYYCAYFSGTASVLPTLAAVIETEIDSLERAVTQAGQTGRGGPNRPVAATIEGYPPWLRSNRRT